MVVVLVLVIAVVVIVVVAVAVAAAVVVVEVDFTVYSQHRDEKFQRPVAVLYHSPRRTLHNLTNEPLGPTIMRLCYSTTMIFYTSAQRPILLKY